MSSFNLFTPIFIKSRKLENHRAYNSVPNLKSETSSEKCKKMSIKNIGNQIIIKFKKLLIVKIGLILIS